MKPTKPKRNRANKLSIKMDDNKRIMYIGVDGKKCYQEDRIKKWRMSTHYYA